MTIEAYFGISILVYLVQVLEQNLNTYAKFGIKIGVKTMGGAIACLNVFMLFVALVWLPVVVGYIAIRSWNLLRTKNK